jgi:hypothetical protein
MPSGIPGKAYAGSKSQGPMNPTPSASLHDFLDEKIRERAYYLWLDDGCPDGKDWQHWYKARQQVLAAIPLVVSEQRPRRAGGSSQLSIRSTAAGEPDDLTPRFHAQVVAPADRRNAVEVESRQHGRGRRSGSSRRSRPKKQA